MQRAGSVLPIILLGLSFGPHQASAQRVLVAVAANFLTGAETIVAEFEDERTCTVHLSPGSSGTLYAQIRNGAPFDVLLSADTLRPALLEAEGLADPGSRFTYARGRLALWAPHATNDSDLTAYLMRGSYRHVAIAMPSTAPYGAAALQTIDRLGLSQDLDFKLVRGGSVIQAHQFVASGAAELGFVAYSQVIDEPSESIWMVDETLYDPILQAAVVLNGGNDNQCAKAFTDFLKGDRAKAIIAGLGYWAGEGS